MSKPLSADAANRRLSANDLEALKRLPDDVDVKLAADAVCDFLPEDDDEHAWIFGRLCAVLPPSVIRACWRRLAAQKKPSSLVRFLVAAVPADGDDATLRAAWTAAVVGARDLGASYAWGSAKQRAKVDGVAAQPRLVDALQAVIAGGADVPNAWRAVLAVEGSEGSVDALLPGVDRAFREGGRLFEGLDSLRSFARAPVMAALLGENAKRLSQRRSVSPALAFAERIGLPPRKRFHFLAAISSREKAGRVPRVQGHVTVDSKDDQWFRVDFARRVGNADNEHSGFTSSRTDDYDQLGLGRCDADELPAWLVGVAKILKAPLEVSYIRSSERGANRRRIVDWLMRDLGR